MSDGMAAAGLRCTQGYSNSAVCSPARFALMTGRYQYRLRGAAEEPINSRSRGNPSLGLPPAHPTLPSMLREAGYRTALMGKCQWSTNDPPFVVVELSPPITAKEATTEVEDRAALEPRGNCATVAVFNEDTEAPVVGQQQWEAVHELRSKGRNLSAIAREPGLDRKTVRTCLSQASWRPYPPAAPPSAAAKGGIPAADICGALPDTAI